MITTSLLPGLVSRICWKKLMRKTTRYALLTMIAVLAPVLTGSEVLFANDGITSSDVIQSLLQSPKLKGPECILQDFVDGELTSRVIVNLHKPATAYSLRNLKDTSVRQQLAEEVSNAVESVLNRLDMAEVRITNRYKYIFGFSAEVTLEGLQSLVYDPDIASIEKDKILEAHTAQGIPVIRATAVRSTYDGSGMSIAICDTGIDYTHPRLGNGGFPNAKVIGGYDTGQDDNDPNDGHGHGTACAGIAAGDLGTVGDYIGGVAPGAKLYALKITFTATGGSAYRSDEVEAWDWCVDHQNDDPNNPIMVISMSFGSGRHTATCDGESTALTTAASNAEAAGMTLFVSSGNDGYCDAISFPACITHVISVGAVYDANIGCYVDETTAPDQVTTYSNSASFLDLLAPSHHCTTTELGGGYWTVAPGFGGTSAACPYAAGAAACLQEAASDIRGSYLTPDEVRNILTNTGDPITDPKVAITTPRVNLYMAVCSVNCDVCSVNCDLWVDFNYSGTEYGSFHEPYNTLAEAVTAASSSETICIKQGSSDETITITKAVTLRTCMGTVIIGQ